MNGLGLHGEWGGCCRLGLFLALYSAASSCVLAQISKSTGAKVDFNRDIRPILSENCYKCHGPDDAARKAKLRFDIRAEALKPAKSGLLPIVPGAPEKSELVARITAADPDDRMPSIKSGKSLSPTQIDLLRRWISQGAPYATHWAYVNPVRPNLPQVRNQRWVRNPVDQFILARLEREGLRPSPQADRFTLIRRVSLDLTGLPPTPEEVDRFVHDQNPQAYEHLVDRLLDKKAYGEHWARMWLDLARYADSAGYADDPLRTIWAYRDYVIKSFNSNKPFDRFTVEQIAGDLLPDASEEDLIATAFHRNTMTNNEGGTDDEEFRNAAIVDRVNTTMAVWMATSIACAQCHNHKYDPITQQDYFRFFAILNNTEDADRSDEAPVLELFTPDQKTRRAQWQAEIDGIHNTFETPTPESLTQQAQWEQDFPKDLRWLQLKPSLVKSRNGASGGSQADGTIRLSPPLSNDVYTVELPLIGQRLAGLRLATQPPSILSEAKSASGSNVTWAVSRLEATLIPPASSSIQGRYVRVELPGKDKILSLAEVQVFSGNENVALRGAASQSSIAYEGAARLAIDNNTDGDYEKAHSTTHTESSENPWWEVDLKATQPLDRLVIWNRTDNGLHTRLQDFRVRVLGADHEQVWAHSIKDPPNPSVEIPLDGARSISFAAAYADASEPGFDPAALLEASKDNGKSWAPRSGDARRHELVLALREPVAVPTGSQLRVVCELVAGDASTAPAGFDFAVSENDRIYEVARTPGPILELMGVVPSQRTVQQAATLTEYYRANVAPELQPQRERLAQLQKQVADLKPVTVPIMRELTGDKRRKTHIQFRGNFLALGDEVTAAVPAVFQPLPKDLPPNRLALARWLVDPDNPLTARVIANRFWEQIFGLGIVRTSEEFGSQGDLPSNPELLNWLATELVAQEWNVKAFLRLLVTSAAYCQSSKVTPELQERDPDNVLLARGPRFRMPAEEVRDQALDVSGLLSPKTCGPSVRPPRPSSGLTAAFGGSLDWKPSDGEDRYRRALYIEWRRTSPYPSMATFDAPNREVCTLRRTRSNTPLQALVTLNDPVYIEAAQALARRIAPRSGSVEDKARFGFELCLVRPPHTHELRRLVDLYEEARARYAQEPEKAKEMATDPVGPAPAGLELADLAAWTVVGNVLLNLDETLMRP
jgi:uncharacterized protein DUF1553/uncharacterized protein DUF1549/cytochrome c/F5/8 type C domain-containing protein